MRQWGHCYIFTVSVLFLSLSGHLYGKIIYVNSNAGGSQDGTSWHNGFLTITAAINAADYNDQIWIKEGVYQERIHIPDGVALYGGFAGTETDLSQRDYNTYMSIIDAQYTGITVTIDNSADSTTRLDGCAVIRGYGIHGGGIKIIGSAPTIVNNLIIYNKTDGAGAGISVWGFKVVPPVEVPYIGSNVIVENRSGNDEGDGGGIAVIGSSPFIIGNTFLRNEATRNGGAIACWRSSQPLIAYNYIFANSASTPVNYYTDYITETDGGGAIFASSTDLDGWPIPDSVAAPEIYNNVIAANAAFKGGGICVINSIRTDLGVAEIINNTIVSNQGAGIYWSNTTPTIVNNLIAYNTIGLHQYVFGLTGCDIRANCVYGNQTQNDTLDYVGLSSQTGIDGNISAAPLLADYRFGKLHLQPGSPCIDAGLSAVIDANWTDDIDGQDRIQGGSVDIGADESDGTLWDTDHPIIRVKPDGNDEADGQSWATAKKTIGRALAAVQNSGGEIWAAAGTYPERINLSAYVYLYGGFAGNETERSQRNVVANPTILDGTGTPTIVTILNAGYLVCALDGWTVQNGGVYTDGNPFAVVGVQGIGGGIYMRVASPLIENNTIQYNSLGTPYAAYFARGGGIACFMGYPIIRDNVIRWNETLTFDSWGGGIYCNLSGPWIENNLITQNHCGRGAAIYGYVSTPLIKGNTIIGNQMYALPPVYMGSPEGAVDLNLCPAFVIENNHFKNNQASIGAAITLASSDWGIIRNNLFIDNIAYDVSSMAGGSGGGIYCINPQNPTGTLSILNNTFSGNTATHLFYGERGGAIALQLLSENVLIANNVMAFNSSGIWLDSSRPYLPTLFSNCMYNTGSNYVNLPAGAGDIMQDPGFVNRTAGDYRLRHDSICINAANPNLADIGSADMDGQPRIRYGRADIGAFEVFPIAGDFEPDEDVDIADLAWIAARWLQTSCTCPGWCGGADLNKDGTVGLADIVLAADHWLAHKF
ncbi:MAG TPA: right-handed parallel beta-helix repeat-containing protein [Anaerohalosphaeraceae bacterium]|nr:right-handed parallel beta-helix repeat-containing protein [Anaerohalosphaeraceae bacterium]